MPKKKKAASTGSVKRKAAKALRMKAEKIVRATIPQKAAKGVENARILHELLVYQAELEMQNDELRQTQEDLECSREGYLSLYDLAPVGYFTLDSTGAVLEANLTAANMLGIAKGKLVSQSFMRSVAPEDQDAFYLFRKNIFWKGKPSSVELRIKRYSGATFWGSLYGTANVGVEGEKSACRLTLSDITARKEAEEKIRTANNEIADLYNNAPCGYHSLGPDGLVLQMNDTELRWLGYTREEVVGKMMYQKFHAQGSLEAFKKDFLRFKMDGSVSNFEISLVRKDGAVFDALVNATAVYDPAGNYSSSRSTIIDITERKRAEEHARQFPKMLMEYQEIDRAMIAAELHDSLAQNMLVVANEIKLVQKGLPAGHPFLAQLAATSDLAIRTMEEILEVAHGLRPSQLDKLGLEKAVDALARRLSDAMKININVEIRLGDAKLSQGMEIQIFRIIQEALTNVIKHSKAKNAFIDLVVENLSIQMDISDDGKGFDRKKEEGDGFGLLGMQERAKIMGGDCKILSGADGTRISCAIHLPTLRRTGE
jgi:PAS domain S-box-containing protein